MRKMQDRLTESAIRTALLTRLGRYVSGRDRVIEELGVEHGYCRVDVAVAAHRLAGYEIKSDFDTLGRLARQMHAYQRVFDSMTLVTTETFVREAEALLPRSWGITLAQRTAKGKVSLVSRRRASRNPHRNAVSLASMLWRDEAYAFLLEAVGPLVRTKAGRAEIYDALAQHVSIDVIETRVLEALRTREVRTARLHDAGKELMRSERQMVTDSVATPCREIA